jgi:hypothetical protein
MRNEPNDRPADAQAERQEVAERLLGQMGEVHELPSSSLGPRSNVNVCKGGHSDRSRPGKRPRRYASDRGSVRSRCKRMHLKLIRNATIRLEYGRRMILVDP